MAAAQSPAASSTGALSPFSLRVDEIAAMLNFELADHPVYDGGELQWFDDETHGTGMLAFLSRRTSRRVDYYVQRGLRVDRGGYEVGGGTGAWTEIDFDVARLVVAEDGVDAEVGFTDVDGRLVEVRVDDRDGRPRRPGGLLAPVSAGIDRPVNLLLVWLPRFDLVRATGAPPAIRIDGATASTGRLPGMRLHRRRLVKYAAPVVTVEVNRSRDEDAVPVAASEPTMVDAQGDMLGMFAESAGHRAELRFAPAFPDLRALPDGTARSGRWQVAVDGTRLTGGAWSVARSGRQIEVQQDVDERWKPGRLPWLMRLVTTIVPVFRRWPTTYRWEAQVRLGGPPTMTARWERTGNDRGRSYRRATGA
jgi:hypothetical protein